jgi:Histone H1-like protein Hc1
MQAFDTIKRILAEIEADVQKAQGGNKAAGTRVRKAMQDIKKAAQEVRTGILQGRDGEQQAT